MRFRWMIGLVLVVACAAVPVERQRQADGSWQLACRVPMDQCVREIEKVCRNKRYVILRGRSETRLRDAPPFATEYPNSHLDFVCDVEEEGSAKGCTPGATQTCVGPGACAGGQICRADGAGYGPCDCGPPKVSDDAGVKAATSTDAAALPPGPGDAGGLGR